MTPRLHSAGPGGQEIQEALDLPPCCQRRARVAQAQQRLVQAVLRMQTLVQLKAAKA